MVTTESIPHYFIIMINTFEMMKKHKQAVRAFEWE